MKKTIIFLILLLSVVFFSACGNDGSPNKYSLVVNSGFGGSVSRDISGMYEEGKEITLSASAGTGYRFLGWFDNEEMLSADNNYLFLMKAQNITIDAKFIELKKYSLEIVKETGGVVSGNNGLYLEGTEITLIASAENGYTFMGWFNEGNILQCAVENYSFFMPDEDVTLVAKFSVAYELKVLKSAGGIVSGAGFYSAGETINMIAEADSGYFFSGWYEGELLKYSNESLSLKMPESNMTIKAVFSCSGVTDLNFDGYSTEVGIASGVKYTKFSATIPAGDYRIKLWQDNIGGDAKIHLGFYINNVSYTIKGTYNGIIDRLPAGTHTFTMQDLKDTGDNVYIQIFAVQSGDSVGAALEMQYSGSASEIITVKGNSLKYLKFSAPAGSYKISAWYASDGPGISLGVSKTNTPSYYFVGIAPYMITTADVGNNYIMVMNTTGSDDLINVRVEAMTPGIGDIRNMTIKINGSDTQFDDTTFKGNKITFFSFTSSHMYLRFYVTKNGEYYDNAIIFLFKSSGSVMKSKGSIFLQEYVDSTSNTIVVYDFYNSAEDFVLHIEEYVPEPGETEHNPIELDYNGEDKFSYSFESDDERYYSFKISAGRYMFSASNVTEQSNIFLWIHDGYSTVCYMYEKTPHCVDYFLGDRNIVLLVSSSDAVTFQMERLL